MGDRCNVVFRSTPADAGSSQLTGAIVLYSHWAGYEMPVTLQAALKAARGRWTDPAYGTRICVSRIVGESWKEETGYGLSVGELCDNSYPLLVVDFSSREVLVTDEAGVTVLRRMEFDQYVQLTPDQAQAFRDAE